MADKDKNINNPEPAPKGQAEVKTDAVKQESQIADDGDLDKELSDIETKLKVPPQPAQETVTEETETKEQTEQEEAVSEDLLKKSPEELAKMYSNLQKKLGEHSDELGTLRKFKDEQEQLKKETESYQLSAANQHIINNYIDSMTSEQTNEFLENFATNPKKALLPIISEAMKPYTLTQAKYNNQMAVQTLKDKTKDDLVSYTKVEKEVNELLAKRDKNGRNEFWDRYGSGAFEKAYNEVRNAKLPEALTQKEKELIGIAQKKAEEEYNKKMRAYTEPQGAVSMANVGKNIDYRSMEADEAIAKLEQILPHSE